MYKVRGWHTQFRLIFNVRFGSQADLLPDITPTAASGGYPAIQLGILENQILNDCFAQYRTFKSSKYHRNDGPLSAKSGRCSVMLDVVSHLTANIHCPEY